MIRVVYFIRSDTKIHLKAGNEWYFSNMRSGVILVARVLSIVYLVLNKKNALNRRRRSPFNPNRKHSTFSRSTQTKQLDMFEDLKKSRCFFSKRLNSIYRIKKKESNFCCRY